VIDTKASHIRNVLHGFFLSIGTTIAEPHTILPIIVTYFGGSTILVGFFSSLIRGGAIIIQLFAAFTAQSYPLVLRYLRRVFFIRFISWFLIGAGIYWLGDSNHTLTLWLIGVGLFFFSFSAGFGAIYFKELNAKIFSHRFRGKTMATRQFFSAIGALISGGVAGYILQSIPAPLSFAYLFMASALLMGFGFSAMGTVKEPIKSNVAQKEKSFKKFLSNAKRTLQADKSLQVQVTTFLLAYSHYFALPFIILHAKDNINLDGVAIGTLITAQMVGSMLSNFLWGSLSSKGHNKRVANISISFSIVAILIAFFAHSLLAYMAIFFLVGAASDGNRIAAGNLLVQIAPEDKRPVYVALQTNIISIGMFFSLFGGLILSVSSFTFLYLFSIVMLILALLSSFRLQDLS
jgi:MFS family permease